MGGGQRQRAILGSGQAKLHLVEAARGRMPLIYGPPATFVLPQGLPTPEQLGKNKVPEAQVAAVDSTWRN